MLNCLRFLGFHDMEDIDRMTFYEYELRMKAYALKRTDEEYRIHLQAWTNREVNAKRKKGKRGMEYVFKDFKKFFDYEKRSRMVHDNRKPEEKKTSALLGRYMEFQRRKRDGEL